MENRQDANSILPYLPVAFRSSVLSWPPETTEALQAISEGPERSLVSSGEALVLAIHDIKSSLGLSSESSLDSAPRGYTMFFDEIMSRHDSEKWFNEIIPALAVMLLRLLSLLETHWQHSDEILNVKGSEVRTGLRILDQQEAGIVVLSQELIGAFLACSFFSLFPISKRGPKHLPMINFDNLFASLYENYSEKQENKIKCIMHYFERICSSMPKGYVSFERKVLPLEGGSSMMRYPEADFWSKSTVPLCCLEVHNSGLIEEHPVESLQVDFANKYIGGGALNRGCVQEEILFMIYPELIAGMLFLPAMLDNEAIEIVGVEKFSCHTGYASSFRFTGDYQDKKDVDHIGRRRTRIIAIDALCNPGRKQYGSQFLLREINKAFCGFFDESKCRQYDRLFKNNDHCSAFAVDCTKDLLDVSQSNLPLLEAPSTSAETERKLRDKNFQNAGTAPHSEENIGIVTGNWGCGAFGGDPHLKTMIQWLAASQALRPSLSYYTFSVEALQKLDKVSRWILMHEWTVGDLWNMLEEYSSQRFKEETRLGFFTWLLPSVNLDDNGTADLMDTS